MLILYQFLLAEQKASPEDLENFSLNDSLFSEIDIEKHVKEKKKKEMLKPKAQST